MIGILLTVLVAALVYLLLVALTVPIVGIIGGDPRADRGHPERRLRIRQPLERQAHLRQREALRTGPRIDGAVEVRVSCAKRPPSSTGRALHL